ncbi:hypothetical protein U1Q18_034358 [Sarracenia purpurea var. burkii]
MVARRLSGLEKPSRELVVQVLGVVAVLTSWCLRTATSEVVGVPGAEEFTHSEENSMVAFAGGYRSSAVLESQIETEFRKGLGEDCLGLRRKSRPAVHQAQQIRIPEAIREI